MPVEDSIIEHRRENAPDGDPLYSIERTIEKRKGSYYTNIEARAADMLGIEEGDTVHIDVHEDAYVIRRTPDESPD